MYHFKNLPDPNIDWTYVKIAEGTVLRPELGYRRCITCHQVFPINNYHFSVNQNSQDGYNAQCKTCAKNYQTKRRHNL